MATSRPWARGRAGALLVLVTLSSGDVRSAPPVHHVPGVILVRPVDGPNPPALASKVSGLGLVLVEDKVGLRGWHRLQVRSAHAPTLALDEAATARAAARLSRDPGLVHAVVDVWMRADSIPDDPLFPQMWHLEALGAPAAWDVTTGSGGIPVGVADSGLLRSHEDVAAKDVGGWDFISYDVMGTGDFVGADGDGRDSDYADPGDGANCGSLTPDFASSSWHGTHIAASIAGATDNTLGVAGVTWGSTVVTARVLGRCGGDAWDVMEGMAWLAGLSVDGVPDLDPALVPRVINASISGGTECEPFRQDIVDAIVAEGVIPVGSAGNDGSATVNAPARCDGVLAVAAAGPDGALTEFTNFGPEVEVVAPGVTIRSATGPGDDSYETKSGTSHAAPLVAGTIALLLDVAPGLDALGVRAALDVGLACPGCGDVPSLHVARSVLGAHFAVVDDPQEDDDTLEEAFPLGCDSSVWGWAADLDHLAVDAAEGDAVTVSIEATTDSIAATLLDPDDGAVLDAATGLGLLELSAAAASGGIAIELAPGVVDAPTLYFIEAVCEPMVVDLPDAGGPIPDAGPVDGGAHDGGPIVAVDAGGAADAGPVVDGGAVPFDAGPPTDAGIDLDGGEVEVDTDEPNDRASDALRVACGDTVEAHTGPSDPDWFVFTLPAGRDVELALRAEVAPVRLALYRADALAAAIETSGGDGLEQLIAVTSLGAGDHLIEAGAKAETGYEMEIICPAAQALDPGPSSSDEAAEAGCAHTGVPVSRSAPAAAGALLALWGAYRRRRRRSAEPPTCTHSDAQHPHLNT